MNGPGHASRASDTEAPLTAAQRAALHAAAVHAEGHVPPSLSEAAAHALAELGLVEALTAGIGARLGPVTRVPRFRVTGAGRTRARYEPLPEVLLVSG